VLEGVDPEERHDPKFYAAVRQGWAGRADFIDNAGRTFFALTRGGWPALPSAPGITAHAPTETGDRRLARGAPPTNLPRIAADAARAGAAALTTLRELPHDDEERGRESRILTDPGLAHLRHLPHLERVQLYGRFTRDGVLGLASLPRLRRLELDGVSGNRAEL